MKTPQLVLLLLVSLLHGLLSNAIADDASQPQLPDFLAGAEAEDEDFDAFNGEALPEAAE